MKPLIGVNCDFATEPKRRAFLYESYIDAVVGAGGVPLLLPPLEDRADLALVFDRLHGVLFTGGDDLNPQRWGESPHPANDALDARKERSDFVLIELAEARRLPVLGICGGCQLINVARGGSLIQDIPSAIGGQIRHRGTPTAPAEHDIDVLAGTGLAGHVGAGRLRVNSAHHQAVGRLGQGLRVTARSADGVIEGIEGEAPGRLLLGVQWHPERIFDWPGQRALFAALVAAAAPAGA